MFCVEHPTTLTLGRRGERSDVLWNSARLEAAGIAVCESPRGGQVTLHAPGQLVVYPVIRIGWRVRAHITHLGEAAATLLRELGVEDAAFRLDHPGVWIGPRKVASIGVHVSRGVTVQGIAINLAVRRALFGALVSCGLPDVTMTNAADEGARDVDLGRTARRYTELLAQRWSRPLQWATAPPEGATAPPEGSDEGALLQ